MADETTDPRPRRRLFGRRRGEEREPQREPELVPDHEPVTMDGAADDSGAPGESESAAATNELSTPESDTEIAPPIGPTPEPVEAVTEQPAVREPAATESPHEDDIPAVVGLPPERGPAPRADPGPTAAADEEQEEPMVTANPSPLAPARGEDPASAAATPVAVDARAESEPPGTADDAVLPLPRIIAIANQKGGVGKTTTAVNLGAALAEAGYRVLVVDLDPQGNASTGLGISPRDVENSVYDVIMTDTPAVDCVEPTSLKNLFVLPATIDLAGAEIELVAAFSRELKLRRALEPLRAEYDLILIDCPPSLGLLTVNGLAAADDVIVPVQSEYYALEGLGQLLKNVAMVRSVNPTLDVRGIVLTMHDSRTKLAEQVELEVREHFGAKVYKTAVPRNVRLAEAPSFGQPIIAFDPASRGAWAYRDLAKEVTGGATRRTR